MADAELSAKIVVDNGIPAAMDKAKAATNSFADQVNSIGAKFKTSFKDIALGFIAPMVLLQHAISYIQSAMEEAKRNAKDGIDLIAKGESRYATAEEAKTAAFFKRKKEIDDEKKLVETGRNDITKQILENEGGQFKDFQLPEKYIRLLSGGSETLSSLSKNKDVQNMAVEYFNKTDAGKRILESMGEKSNVPARLSYQGPQGFGNVIGVGNNPVVEAMSMQLEEAKKTNELLANIASGHGTSDGWLTSPAPSRASMLKSK
jgi:hypothetical protein